jgi:hypothetical protein
MRERVCVQVCVRESKCERVYVRVCAKSERVSEL